MKRFHVHVAVAKLEESVRFYTKLFGAAPSVVRADYAKWMLNDPRVNFAISGRGGQVGINHVGFQVDTAEELTRLRSQLDAADADVIEQTGVSCCYARSDKHWITDPSGIAWETFQSMGELPTFGEGASSNAESGACCIPLAATSTTSACCVPATDTPDKGSGCCA